jgi:16S rRNA (guanine527-N7)-methyltransferase
MLQIEEYCLQLVQRNKQVNLISRKDINNILDKHILHSLSVLKYIKPEPGTCCLDIGTGGGLPGIPLAIALPGTKFLLVDSISKKIQIVSQIAIYLGCNNIELSDNKVEQLYRNPQIIFKNVQSNNQRKKKSYRMEKFDYVFSRAVSKVKNIIEWSMDLIKNDSTIILYKGGDLTDEISQAKKLFPEYYIEEILIELDGYNIFQKEEKKLVKIKKNI